MSPILIAILLQGAPQSVESLDHVLAVNKATIDATTNCAEAKIKDWIMQKESAEALAEAALSYCDDKSAALLPALEHMLPNSDAGRAEAQRLANDQRDGIKKMLVLQTMEWRAQLMKKVPRLFFP